MTCAIFLQVPQPNTLRPLKAQSGVDTGEQEEQRQVLAAARFCSQGVSVSRNRLTDCHEARRVVKGRQSIVGDRGLETVRVSRRQGAGGHFG